MWWAQTFKSICIFIVINFWWCCGKKICPAQNRKQMPLSFMTFYSKTSFVGEKKNKQSTSAWCQCTSEHSVKRFKLKLQFVSMIISIKKINFGKFDPPGTKKLLRRLVFRESAILLASMNGDGFRSYSVAKS